jgi:hypothetical protein
VSEEGNFLKPPERRKTVLYTCTIYSHDYTFGGAKGFTGTDPVFAGPTVQVEVSATSMRQAAARAWVKCIGRARAKRLARKPGAPREIAAQEKSCKAIAASLRKTVRRIGECYELDNFVEAWFIKVAAVSSRQSSSVRLHGPRISLPLLHHLSSSPSPN